MTNSESNVVLTASNLVKKFDNLTAVAGVSLSLKVGECLALLGPNGAGKTTTCEMLEGLIPQTEGDIKIRGMSYHDKRREILEEVGVQLQETSLYKKYTVKETLNLFASFYKKPEPVDSIMKKLGLVEKSDARLETLSGGQKQRVYLGCAMINNPKILFLDEPTTGLDPQARRNIWEIVEQLKREDRSVLLTTHYMEEAEKLADRVAIMDNGKIIAEGTPESLIRDICKGEVIRVGFESKGRSNEQICTLMSSSIGGFKSAKISGDVFEITTPDAGSYVQEIIRAADQLKFKITSLSMRPGTLEDVFIKLTGRSIGDD